VPRRIDIQLTSARGDGSFTWRAAGAKQPKGTVDGSLLFPGAKVGDVVRAEADFDIEGITITNVEAPPAVREETAARVEIVGSHREDATVTTSLVPKRERDRDRHGDRDRGRSDRGDRSKGGRARPERSGARPERRDRPPRPERSQQPSTSARPRPKRVEPKRVHRDALLAELSQEERPIAEQLLRGGLPSVRAAIAEQNKTRREGTPEINDEPLMTLADQLHPRVREADWRDRAEATAAVIEEVGLRDLRAVVTAADQAARGEEAKELATRLRETLERRLEEQRTTWLNDITTSLDESKVTRALRLSGRPPDPTTKLPPELLTRLTDAASQAMAPDTPTDRWASLLEAVVSSPVRRNVKPVGLPDPPGAALLLLARQSAGRVPALAAMLGVDIPPPPGPRRAPPPPPPSPPSPPSPASAPPA
jgi:hypothetical protein